MRSGVDEREERGAKMSRHLLLPSRLEIINPVKSTKSYLSRRLMPPKSVAGVAGKARRVKGTSATTTTTTTTTAAAVARPAKATLI